MRKKTKNRLALGLAMIVFFLSGCGGESLQLNCRYQATADAGKKFYQPLISALEKYKADHNNYPANVFELVPKYIEKIPGTPENAETANSSDETGALYADKNMKSQIIGTRPDIKSYFITFYFRDDSNCFLNKNGACSYSVETQSWSCK